MHPFQLNKLKLALKQGAIIAYPTETVWGLGCLPNDETALIRLAKIKQRPVHKGFILVASDISYCLDFIHPDFHQQAIKKVICNVQHPTTWLVPKAQGTSRLLSGDFSTIAIRISPHPFIKLLCSKIQAAFVSTSVNINSRPSLNSSILIQKQFGHQLDAIVHGFNAGLGKASKIIDLQSGAILRH